MRDSTERKTISNVRFPVSESLTDWEYIGLIVGVIVLGCLVVGSLVWAVM
jgi:hypothetical protein